MRSEFNILFTSAGRRVGLVRLFCDALESLGLGGTLIAADLKETAPACHIAGLCELTPHHVKRHDVRPGITGWAQVNGRNAIDRVVKFAFDFRYGDHWSIELDLKILALTVARVDRRKGVNAEGEATASALRGTSPRAAS